MAFGARFVARGHDFAPQVSQKFSAGLSTGLQFESWSCNLIPRRRTFYPRSGNGSWEQSCGQFRRRLASKVWEIMGFWALFVARGHYLKNFWGAGKPQKYRTNMGFWALGGALGGDY